MPRDVSMLKKTATPFKRIYTNNSTLTMQVLDIPAVNAMEVHYTKTFNTFLMIYRVT